MEKFVILLEQAMKIANILINFKKFLNCITVNEEGKHLYQNVHLIILSMQSKLTRKKLYREFHLV